MVKDRKPIDHLVDPIFKTISVFRERPLKELHFRDMSKEEIDEFDFTNHDMDHIGLFHRSTRCKFWMFNGEGLVNFEGARVLFRRRKVQGTFIKPLEVLNNCTNDAGRMYVHITNSNYGSRNTLKKSKDKQPKSVDVLVDNNDIFAHIPFCVLARWFLQTLYQ